MMRGHKPFEKRFDRKLQQRCDGVIKRLNGCFTVFLLNIWVSWTFKS